MAKVHWISLLAENYARRSNVCCNTVRRIATVNTCILDEYNGYSFFDAISTGDTSRVKKFLTNETIHFRHVKTGDSPLVSTNGNEKELAKLV